MKILFRISSALLPLAMLIMASCRPGPGGDAEHLFTLVRPEESGIDFRNELTETDSFNYFLFSYIYMGGGVSAGDFNSDGLTDIYLVANMEANHLYLNRGGLRFEEVGLKAGVAGDDRWMLGSTLCDINNDGLHDIYVSVSGLLGNTENLLYVNQGLDAEGIPVFTEEAHAYGIADPGLSTQAVFFDYDLDGDLDLYVANYPITHFKAPPFFYRQMMRSVKWADSDHLYRNNSDGTFSDVSIEAGLLSFGLTLSASVSDLNLDGYPDIYISNDFTSPDYFFMNNGDGTFSERCGEVAGQTSFYGMGADVADYNNDGLQDIMQIDMAPEDNKRSKENMLRMRAEDFQEMLDEGLHHQYRYSTLFLNRGVQESGLPYFTNAAWIAGVHSTDWSWAALFADFDLDGWKDLYITNGSRRDINNIDYFNKMQKSVYFDAGLDRGEFLEQIEHMPQLALVNYMYRNNADYSFSRVNREWGMEEESFSNGVLYADLDNDGDLELVVNNIDQEAQVYRNYARESGAGNYLKIRLKGPEMNPMGIGALVRIWHGELMQVAELVLSRGYQSSVEPFLYFGLDTAEFVDSLEVSWPGGPSEKLYGLRANREIGLDYSNAVPASAEAPSPERIFRKAGPIAGAGIRHLENTYNDYAKQVLLPHRLSMLGPEISVGDANQDGLEDFFMGNASGSTPVLCLQEADGSFSILEGPWQEDAAFEDAGSVFFDANGDALQDLYVVSGGNHLEAGAEGYQDRLYINRGGGRYLKADMALPDIRSSGSCVLPLDMDQDGDLDLFIGGRHLPGKYPMAPRSYILENNSSGDRVSFRDVTMERAPFLADAGMVTSALAADLDGNGHEDLVLAGEWMPVCICLNNGKGFEKRELEGTSGWWFSLATADFDADGDQDIVAGNLGLNARFQRTSGAAFEVYAGDFEGVGDIGIAMTYTQDGRRFPLRSRDCFISQHPGLAKRYPTYAAFGEASIEDIYGKKALNEALHLRAETFASACFENLGGGEFRMKALPPEAQLSPLLALVTQDFDGDGHTDILAAGNMYNVEIVTPRFDGGVGIFLRGSGDGSFVALPSTQSGFFAPGDVKSLAPLKVRDDGGLILVGNNNAKMEVFKW